MGTLPKGHLPGLRTIERLSVCIGLVDAVLRSEIGPRIQLDPPSSGFAISDGITGVS